MSLPLSLFSTAQIRQLEAMAIAGGVSGYSLMKRAAVAAGAVLHERWPDARRVAIVCGGGNNGGDGFALARVLAVAGSEVAVLRIGDPARLRGEAAQAHADLQESGAVEQEFDATDRASLLARADVVVDALLGIGVRAPLNERALQAIAAINACGRPVLALDLPSGLDPDRGIPLPCVRATATISFVGLKQGIFLGEGPAFCGAVYFDSLGIDPQAAPMPPMRRITACDVQSLLPRRSRDSHKGTFGRVLIIGGGVGMPGAVRLAGEAALRVGAGLVTVATLPQHEAIIIGARPELMFRTVSDAASLQSLLPTFDVIAIGPGLGVDTWGQSLLQTVLAARTAGQALVVDADALNLLASHHPDVRCDDWILTPHPGEAARLLGSTTGQVQADRPAALAALLQQRGGVVVLKGAGTLVGQAGEVTGVCDRGNPGMAVPGMGDVLTGAIAGLLAQRRDPFAAASAGVFLHAAAGDRCALDGQRGVLALEVATTLRHLLAEFCA